MDFHYYFACADNGIQFEWTDCWGFSHREPHGVSIKVREPFITSVLFKKKVYLIWYLSLLC